MIETHHLGQWQYSISVSTKAPEDAAKQITSIFQLQEEKETTGDEICLVSYSAWSQGQAGLCQRLALLRAVSCFKGRTEAAPERLRQSVPE